MQSFPGPKPFRSTDPHCPPMLRHGLPKGVYPKEAAAVQRASATPRCPDSTAAQAQSGWKGPHAATPLRQHQKISRSRSMSVRDAFVEGQGVLYK